MWIFEGSDLPRKKSLPQAMQAPPLDWKGYDHERT